MGFNAEFYGPGRPWLEVLPGLAVLGLCIAKFDGRG